MTESGQYEGYEWKGAHHLPHPTLPRHAHAAMPRLHRHIHTPPFTSTSGEVSAASFLCLASLDSFSVSRTSCLMKPPGMTENKGGGEDGGGLLSSSRICVWKRGEVRVRLRGQGCPQTVCDAAREEPRRRSMREAERL